MKVNELRYGRTVTVMRRCSLRDAARSMRDQGVDSLLVIERGHLEGIVTAGDLMRCIAGEGEPDLATVASCMSPCPSVISPYAEEEEAMRRMALLHVRHLPVVHKGTVLGVLTVTDLLHSEMRSAAA